MGMYLGLYTLSDENIQKVLTDPPLIWKVLTPYDPERGEQAQNERPAGFLSKLFGIDEAFLKSRSNPSAMMRLKIYPEIWDRDPMEDDSFGYCVEVFDELKSFVAQAAERNLGIIIELT